MTTAPKKIALFGYFGMGNFGNDASLQAMLRQIRQRLPTAQVSCVCYDPGTVEKLHGLPGVRLDTATEFAWGAGTKGVRKWVYKVLHRLKAPSELLSWWRSIIYLRKVDLMIASGTGLLDDFGTGPFQVPYDVFKWSLAAKLAGAKVLFVSIGAGPILHPLSRWFMKWAAWFGDYRSYRDQLSKDFMASLGLDVRRDPVYPDLVFSLPVTKWQNGGSRNGKPPSVALGLIAYQGWGDQPERAGEIYRACLKNMKHLIRRLQEKGYAVRLLTGDTHDDEALENILAALDGPEDDRFAGQLTVESVSSLEDVLREIAATDIVVASRFHNVVSALMLGTPAISIEYAPKNRALLEDMGLGAYCHHMETVEIDRVVAQVDELTGRRTGIKESLEEKNRVYRERLDEQFARVLSCANP
jgi:polysaccharide pyruvyl transferase WcaK-like protein